MAHWLSEEDISELLKTDKTMTEVMLEVRDLTGADNFIAVVNHLPKGKM